MAEALGARISRGHGPQEAETPSPLREEKQISELLAHPVARWPQLILTGQRSPWLPQTLVQLARLARSDERVFGQLVYEIIERAGPVVAKWAQGYTIYLKYALPLGPQKVIDAEGKRYGVIVLAMLWLEKMIQIIFRLRDLGIESPEITNKLIDEFHKVTRLREESVANLQGTCVPEYSRLVS
jgi:hypothetical protein